jgi:hypothetical protein
MNALFTCSTDDGHPLDMKMAELLDKSGLNGTFFIPIHNREGPPVMSTQEIREIARQFEVGSHTCDHCYLRTVRPDEARRQIRNGKQQLEDQLGQAVAGFCYPGGAYTAAHSAMVRAAGFEYARTTMNLRFDPGESRFEIPTTIQFYPHPRAVYARNFLRGGCWTERTTGLGLALQHKNWLERVYALFDHACQHDTTFHVWAHSGDIDQLHAWADLERFFVYVATRITRQNRLTNQQLVARTYPRLAR